jgi:hypothetical protein
MNVLIEKFGKQLLDSGVSEDFDLKVMFTNFISEYEQNKPKPKKPKKKPKKPRKKTGYNIFIKEKMPDMKEFAPKERFRELGKIWKAYSEDEKMEWKEKANVINDQVVPVEVVPVEVVPVEVVPVEVVPVEVVVEEPVEPIEEQVEELPKKKRGRPKKKKEEVWRSREARRAAPKKEEV